MKKFALIACTALSTALLSTVAFAQESSTPRSLTPRALEPVSQSPKATDSTATTEVKTLSGGLTITTLGSINNNAIGTLSGEKALARDLWSKGSKDWTGFLLENMPNDIQMRSLKPLLRKALLSVAPPPRDVGTGFDWTTLRVKGLVKLGFTQDALALLKALPAQEKNEPLARLRTELSLISGDLKSACAEASFHVEKDDEDRFWTKTLTFCRALAGQPDLARLSMNLLREEGIEDESFFSHIGALIDGNEITLTRYTTLSALEQALINAGKVKFDLEKITEIDPSLYDSLLKSDQLALDKRLELALKAEAEGNIGILTARELAMQARFKKSALENPIEVAEKLSFGDAISLLYQIAVKTDQIAVVRAEAIAMALELGERNKQRATISRLLADTISELPASIDLLWFAKDGFLTGLANSNDVEANRWFGLLRNATFNDPAAKQAWKSLRPLACLSGSDTGCATANDLLTNWWEEQPASPESFAKADLLFAIMETTGAKIYASLRQAQINGPVRQNTHTPKPGLWHPLLAAAQNKNMGDSLLLIAHGLSGTHTAQLDPRYVSDVIATLNDLGLRDDAKNLAVEIVVDAGF